MVDVIAQTDEQIRQNVIDQLDWDGKLEGAQIEVEVSGDTVTLKGTVPSYAARQAARADAVIASGLQNIDNRLQVQFSPGAAAPADDIIATGIRNVLAWSSSIDATRIVVTVNAGIVTLEGAVDAFWKKIKAHELAGDVEGVLSVNDTLTVVPSGRIGDEALAQNILRSIHRSVPVNLNRLTIMVEDGNVTITGTVPDSIAFYAIENILSHTRGVVSFNNGIRVEPGP